MKQIDLASLSGLSVSKAKKIVEDHGYNTFIFGADEFITSELRDGIILWTEGDIVKTAEKGF